MYHALHCSAVQVEALTADNGSAPAFPRRLCLGRVRLLTRFVLPSYDCQTVDAARQFVLTEIAIAYTSLWNGCIVGGCEGRSAARLRAQIALRSAFRIAMRASLTDLQPVLARPESDIAQFVGSVVVFGLWVTLRALPLRRAAPS